jgi:hypothetical protein
MLLSFYYLIFPFDKNLSGCTLCTPTLVCRWNTTIRKQQQFGEEKLFSIHKWNGFFHTLSTNLVAERTRGASPANIKLSLDYLVYISFCFLSLSLSCSWWRDAGCQSLGTLDIHTDLCRARLWYAQCLVLDRVISFSHLSMCTEYFRNVIRFKNWIPWEVITGLFTRRTSPLRARAEVVIS